ncbi:hypothetical protein C2E21_2893 [Chlorella sorokiniana]|uniref:phytol kinase n=1 Tax=Chlorella sorokiniana TaxID=3076 RepID=A0A2P6TWC6_CHLSO|nr:hypothetical protein C2E21_2893 [Chlorella sorokiniana]|eukprot:PRW58358.1 hypothetical protein C2E21_2893 [Chlorella sorokiniana]
MIASVGEPVSGSPDLLALVEQQLELLQAQPAGSISPVGHLTALTRIAGRSHAVAATMAFGFPWQRWLSGSVDARDAAAVLELAYLLSLRLGAVGARDTPSTHQDTSSLAVQQVVHWMSLLHEDSAVRSDALAFLQPLGPSTRLTAQQRQQIQRSAARFVKQGLPLMRGLAEVLQALWQQQQPERQRQVQLELARAAAARPGCSYLRCAQVQGAKIKRCTGCRAVRYCSVACQHADWRQGGHRQVCRLLGAAAEQQGPA